ncbi:hypothetical protein CHS0354_039958 [Potamilus streckersoni]|uniref:Alpha-carbonic anhydrase domain-containing protein n=1 Tax=Potamilus streckersoni TaxID=2493646 RepID=A0AAE0T1R4_9BIVA|nr:hypothetical protein CHS0354_039958 [Potamilus streckersoni]
MHIVHYSAKYINVSQTLDKHDGLAVLAFLFEVGRHNIHLDDLINHLLKIPYRVRNMFVYLTCQLNAFRQIHPNFANQTTSCISDDFRHTQPLNLRVVSCSKNVQTRGN